MTLPAEFKNKENAIFWFRRDLRLNDNRALFEALSHHSSVIPVFIFDTNILQELKPSDQRVQIIHKLLEEIQTKLKKIGSSLYVFSGTPTEFYEQVDCCALYFNRDYEPYAAARDERVTEILQGKGIPVHTFKDHVIFERSEVLTNQGNPYTVYTPYSRKWREQLGNEQLKDYDPDLTNLARINFGELPKMEDLGFDPGPALEIPLVADAEILRNYSETRNDPNLPTSRLGVALRFGALSIRELMRTSMGSDTFQGELIWRDFFQMIIHHYPDSAYSNFKRAYDAVPWRYDDEEFQKWKEGKTGFPIVDAGMRELKETGFMHNRVRMITASFLVKHLLHHWPVGEAWFAEKLLDYELASNAGNWQWAAGTGCDAAPYFRVFNPYSQAEKFDPHEKYIKKWIPEYGTSEYPEPMVDHAMARTRAINTYKDALANQN